MTSRLGHAWVAPSQCCMAGLLLISICYSDTSTLSYKNGDDDNTTTTVSQGAIPHYLVAPPVTSPKPDYFKIICEFKRWNGYPTNHPMSVQEVIDMDLCSHIIYDSVSLDSDTLLISSGQDFEIDTMKIFYRLTMENIKKRGIKVTLNTYLRRLFRNPEEMSAFNKHAVGYLTKEGYDGLQLELELLPSPMFFDNDSILTWLKELHATFQPHGLSLSFSDLRDSEIIPTFAEHADWVTVRTHYTESEWKTFRPNTLFYGQQSNDAVSETMLLKALGRTSRSTTVDGQSTGYLGNVSTGVQSLNQRPRGRRRTYQLHAQQVFNETIHYWISKGVPRRKLVITLPSTGMSFTLASANDTGVGAKAIGYGEPGKYTNSSGYLAYIEICDRIRNQEWVVVQDPMGSYAHKGDQWVSFEGLIVIQKMSQYIRWMDLGGAAADMTCDDFKNLCGGGHYPVLSTIRQVLGAVKATGQAPNKPDNFMTEMGSYFGFIICISAIFGYRVYQMKQRHRWKSRNDTVAMEKKMVFLLQNIVQGNEYNLSLDPHWEYSRDNIVLGELLGEGEFGRVVRAELTDDSQRGSTSVAVKMLKEIHSDSDMIGLVREMKIMKMIGNHINIINLIGCCTQGRPLYLILEYAPLGNLRDFLRECRPNSQKLFNGKGPHVLNERSLFSSSFQIARGMEYLASKKLIHRDLAARNILVSHELIMKIADFGLTQDVNSSDHRRTIKGKLPIRWMSPEALFEQVSTFQSDVWSYGVVLWEIFTLGGMPYPSVSNEELYDMLKSGHRMEKPAGCSDEMYQIMRDCWMYRPMKRPTFGELVLRLDRLLAQASNTEYLEVYVHQSATTAGDIGLNFRV